MLILVLETFVLTKSQDAGVVDFSFEEGGVIKVSNNLNQVKSMANPAGNSRLAANFKSYTRCVRLGIVDSLGARFDVIIDFVVVGRGEGMEIVQAVHGDRVFGRAVAYSGRPAPDFALGNVICGLRSNEESVASQDSVCGESRPLCVLNVLKSGN